MARIIEVTPEELETTATRIESLASDYQNLYNQLYSQTDSMASTWQGKDNIAFTDQISGFKDDFAKMFELMNRYVSFLRMSAKTYQGTQDQVASEARKLTN